MDNTGIESNVETNRELTDLERTNVVEMQEVVAELSNKIARMEVDAVMDRLALKNKDRLINTKEEQIRILETRLSQYEKVEGGE